MRKRLITCIMMILCLICSAQVYSEERIRIAIGEFPPAYSEYIQNYGYVSHLITEAFAVVNIKADYAFYPWKRAYVMARNGSADCAGVWYKTKEIVQDKMQLSEPFEDVTTNFFHLKSRSFDWKTLDDLAGLKIGITLGYSYPEDFLKAGRSGKFVLDETPKDESNLKKLEIGRIDLFPSGPIPTYVLLRKIFPPEKIDLFTYHPVPLLSEPNYVIFSPQTNPAVIERFNQGLRQLKASGRYDQILKDVKEGKYPIMETKWVAK